VRLVVSNGFRDRIPSSLQREVTQLHRIYIPALFRAIPASVALPTTVCPSSDRAIEVIKACQ
jgi:hypothetical protein